MGLVAVSALKPEAIPINVKIIFVGSSKYTISYTTMTEILESTSKLRQTLTIIWFGMMKCATSCPVHRSLLQ